MIRRAVATLSQNAAASAAIPTYLTASMVSDRNVAVADRDREAAGAEAPGQILGENDRAVAAARAADGDGRVRLPLAQEPLHGTLHQPLRVVEERPGLGVVHDESHHRVVLARQG